MFHVLIHRTHALTRETETIPAMEVDQASGPIPIQHFPHALHDLSVIPNAIQVQPIDLRFPKQIGQTFKVIIEPARSSRSLNHLIHLPVIKRLLPSWSCKHPTAAFWLNSIESEWEKHASNSLHQSATSAPYDSLA